MVWARSIGLAGATAALMALAVPSWADVTVTEGTHTIVYAWGSLADKNLQLAVQTIGGLHTSPASVPGARDGSSDAMTTGSASSGGVSAGTAVATVGFSALALALLLGGVNVARGVSARRVKP